MYKTNKFLLLILFLLLACRLAIAQSGDSARFYGEMQSLEEQYRQKKITGEQYLTAADTIAPLGYALPGYSERMGLFKKLAFATEAPNRFKVRYYLHLSFDAAINDQTGRSVYFKRRSTDERVRLSHDHSAELTMASFMIGTYVYFPTTDKAITEYRKILPYLQSVPELIAKDSLGPDAAKSSLKILMFIMPVPAFVKDSAALRVASVLARRIYDAASARQTDKWLLHRPSIRYFYYRVKYYEHRFLDAAQPGVLAGDIDTMQAILLSAAYKKANPDYAVNLLSEFYIFVAKEAIDAGRPDEGIRYINMDKALGLDTARLGSKKYYDLLCEAEYHKGNYKLAYTYLSKAYELQTQSLNDVLLDKDNNLYAQAEAEDQRDLLAKTRQQKNHYEGRFRLLAACALALVATAILLPLYLRQRQRARFLSFKLNMARNLHDETNPALLYAKALAKTNRLAGGNGIDVKSELEQHIEYTMVTIRNLSHDLKSEYQHTISELSKELGASLRKLGRVHHFSYRINDKAAARKFLSHHQFTHLRAILLECISNSVKHASFDQVEITFRLEQKKLYITYSDNGRGWPPAQEKGIGMDNMAERSRQLNGELRIQNNFPEGYAMVIVIPVRSDI